MSITIPAIAATDRLGATQVGHVEGIQAGPYATSHAPTHEFPQSLRQALAAEIRNKAMKPKRPRTQCSLSKAPAVVPAKAPRMSGKWHGQTRTAKTVQR